MRTLGAGLLGVMALAGCSGFDIIPKFNVGSIAGASDPDLLHQAGMLHLQAGRLGNAQQAFEAALTLDRGHIEAHNALASVYDRMGRFDLAERQYRKALSVDPNHLATLNNYGWSYHLAGKEGLAEFYLEQARALDPEHPVVAANLERVREAQERARELAGREPPPTPTAWIERSGRGTQTLVVETPEERREALRKGGVPAHLAHLSRPEPTIGRGAVNHVPLPLSHAGEPVRAAPRPPVVREALLP